MQEGAAIVAFKLVSGGVFDEEGVTALLQAPGKLGNPLCIGTRNLQDNLSDLKAQVRRRRPLTIATSPDDPYVKAYMRARLHVCVHIHVVLVSCLCTT